MATADLNDEDWPYVADVFDALRALTIDAPGKLLNRQDLGIAISRWLIKHNRPTVPRGSMNRILKRAGHPRSRINDVQVVRGLQFRQQP